MIKNGIKDQIKIGFCVAYDWHMLSCSLPIVYRHADKICLSVDKNRISWSGNPYTFDETSFYELVRSIDVAKKIEVIEGDYYLPQLSPMENEVRQRNLIAEHLGDGGWHIQLDCDEYFLDFENFVRYLKQMPAYKVRDANICCAWVILYKQTQQGFLYVDPVQKNNIEFMQIAARKPRYEYSRRNGSFNIYTNFRILHQSWARDEQEIRQKLSNWGHSHEIDPVKYFNLWSALNETNYQSASDLHPLVPSQWPLLKFVQGARIDDILSSFNSAMFPSLGKMELILKNSRMLSRFRAHWKKTGL